MKKSWTKLIRYITAILLGAGLIVLVIKCDVDPWVRGETTVEVHPKTGVRTEIQTNNVKITKTIQKYTGSSIPIEISFKKSLSTPVIMSHKVHISHGITCVTCHHKTYNPERKKICASCHYEFDGMDTMHRFCLGCHKAEKNGIEKCNQCHK